MRCERCHAEFTLESEGHTIYSVLVACPFLCMGSFFVRGLWDWLVAVASGSAEMPTSNSLFLSLLFASFLAFGLAYLVKSAVRWKNDQDNPPA